MYLTHVESLDSFTGRIYFIYNLFNKAIWTFGCIALIGGWNNEVSLEKDVEAVVAYFEV